MSDTDPDPGPLPEFRVDIDRQGNDILVAVRGDVDVYTAPQLRERLYAVLTDGAARVVLDVSKMTFIDSTGLGVIVGTLKRLREQGGDLILAGPSRSALNVLEITGLSRIIETVETVEPAGGGTGGPGEDR